MTNRDDDLLEEYLDGDSALHKAYADAGGEQPPLSLDQAILAQAKSAVAEDTVVPLRRPKWLAPVGLAATVMLGIGLAFNLKDFSPDATPSFDVTGISKPSTQSNDRVLAESEMETAEQKDAFIQDGLGREDQETLAEKANTPNSLRDGAISETRSNDIDADQFLDQVKQSQSASIGETLEERVRQNSLKKKTHSELADSVANPQTSDSRKNPVVSAPVLPSPTPAATPNEAYQNANRQAAELKTSTEDRARRRYTNEQPTVEQEPSSINERLAKEKELNDPTESSARILASSDGGSAHGVVGNRERLEPSRESAAAQPKNETGLTFETGTMTASPPAPIDDELAGIEMDITDQSIEIFTCQLEAQGINQEILDDTKIFARTRFDPPLDATTWLGHIADLAEEGNYFEACANLAAYSQINENVVIPYDLPVQLPEILYPE